MNVWNLIRVSPKERRRNKKNKIEPPKPMPFAQKMDMKIDFELKEK